MTISICRVSRTTPDSVRNWPTPSSGRWDYFVEHLMGIEPPRDVVMENEQKLSF